MYTSPLLMLDSRLVTTSGSNVTAWPDASGVRSPATVLAGTPTLGATAGPGGGPAVDMTSGQVFDAGASPVLPVSGAWTVYALYRIVTLDAIGNYVFSQYVAGDAGRSGIAYVAAESDHLMIVRAAYGARSGAGVDNTWGLRTYARNPGSTTLAAEEESEATAADPGGALTNSGFLVGGVAVSGAYNNAGALARPILGLFAHISAWSGYHTAAQRAKVRASIRTAHGI